MEWTFVTIDGSAKRDNFDCGVTELNDYLIAQRGAAIEIREAKP